jgi:NTP pyrophosphatase (non-canonical NTP hydrolase)
MRINELSAESHGRAVRKGFYEKPRTVADILSDIHGEISEALDECRAGRMQLWSSIDSNGYVKPEGFGVELADALIRICDLAGHLGIDLERLIRLKSDYNETRPIRHGKVL